MTLSDALPHSRRRDRFAIRQNRKGFIHFSMVCVCVPVMLLAQEQFTELAVAEMGVVCRIARRLSDDATRAEDLVQETYLRAIKASGRFDLREFGIRPWLVRILHGVHFNRLKSDSRQPKPADDASFDIPAREERFSGSNDPHGFESMDQRLVKAIKSLRGPYRDALLLWAVEDLNYAEIAETLCVPIGTVMSRLHRARKQLRERLENFSMASGAP
jgi:RNA polymerase sigma-70 factor (ECF subfamily)